MRTRSLALRFAIELACLAALVYWGAGATANSMANRAIAIAAPLTAATIWGVWSAPRAPRRLSGLRLASLELTLLSCCCALLALAGVPLLATALFLLALANAAMLGRLETAATDR
jgi:Protein of unknown function (DUF2568)